MNLHPFNEAVCRYLFSPGPGVSGYSFQQACQRLDVGMPEALTLEDMHVLGWLRPQLRVALPQSLFEAWGHFAAIHLVPEGLRQEDYWAWNLWSYSANANAGQRGARWYEHFLDEPDGEIRVKALQNGLSPCDALPEQIEVHGREVSPWVDFYGYWQLYRISALANAARVGSLYAPDLNEQLDSYREGQARHQSFAEFRVKRVMQDWDRLEQVFDWVSRYRTLRGIALSTGETLDIREGAKQLAEDLDLTPERMRKDLRDGLLVAWRDNESRRKQRSSLGLVLQEDVERAKEFLELVDGEIDLRDPYWHPDDRQPRAWSRLVDVLPYEGDRARHSFPSHAQLYLRELSSALPDEIRLTTEKVDSLLEHSWTESPPLRRIVLAFSRLHEQYSGEEPSGALVGLLHRNPADFLLFGALLVEKLLRNQVASAPPKFNPLVVAAARKTVAPTSINANAFCKELTELLRMHSDLTDLLEKPRDPFLHHGDLQGTDPKTTGLLRVFTNFAILRNYAAHHDCLDHRFIHDPVGEAAMQAFVAVPLLVLHATIPNAGAD